jgi:hypothetical protein
MTALPADQTRACSSPAIPREASKFLKITVLPATGGHHAQRDNQVDDRYGRLAGAVSGVKARQEPAKCHLLTGRQFAIGENPWHE